MLEIFYNIIMKFKEKFTSIKTSRLIGMIITILIGIMFIVIKFCPVVQYSETEIVSQISLGFSYVIDIIPILLLIIFEILNFILCKKLYYVLSLVFVVISFIMFVFYGFISNLLIWVFFLIGLLYLVNIILIIILKESSVEVINE